MQIRFLRLTSLAAFLCIGVLVGAGAARAQSYTFTTLDAPGGTATYAFGINGSGTIVGFYLDSGNDYHGFLYGDDTYTTIDVSNSANFTVANTINDNGDVAGFYADGSNMHGFLYNGSTYTTLDDPNASGMTDVYAINDKGDIAGSYRDSNLNWHGFYYDGSTYTTLDDPNGVGNTYAYGINDSGDIVGQYEDSSGNYHGFLYSGDTYTTIDVPNSVNFTVATAINDNGDIVGYYNDSKGLTHGFLAVDLWQNGVATGGGWYYLGWFGAFNTNSSPWIYHNTLGWLYPIGTSTGSIWFWDPQWDSTGGWWWTSASAFPWVYSATEGSWYYYDAGDSNPSGRWFCNSSSGCALH